MLYKQLAQTYEKLSTSTKRLEKTYYLSILINESSDEDLPFILSLIQGRVFPEWDERKLGVAARIALKAISVTSGCEIKKLENDWKNTGDLGDVAFNFIKNKVQSTLFSNELTINKVYNNLVKISEQSGKGAVDFKVKLICELLSNASPLESKFIIRTVLEELRVGIGDGTIRDAIVWSSFPKIIGIWYKCPSCGKYMPNIEKCLECGAKIETKFTKEFSIFKGDALIDEPENIKKNDLKGVEFIVVDTETKAREVYDYLVQKIQTAFNIANDFSKVAVAARKGINELDRFELTPGSPIKVMLAQKVGDIKEGFERVGTPCAIEYKYDGFRLQCHKIGNKITLFTRRLENVTQQFPDVVNAINKYVDAESFILDAEAVGFNPKTTQYLPFQFISQRIKRKYNTEQIAKKIPVELNVFDIMSLNGKNLIDEPFQNRRKLLTKIINPQERIISQSRIILTDDETQGLEFYNKSLDSGNEGVMLKNLHGVYKPGSRVGFMIKLKPVMESLDLVITGASWGEGKRAKWLTSFTVSCIDENNEFLEIGKVGTGIKELEGEGVTFKELTDSLTPLILWEKGSDVKVKPLIVVEINYEEIQKSTNYSSGYALRFPRLKLLRDERSPQDISTVQIVEDLFDNQRHRK